MDSYHTAYKCLNCHTIIMSLHTHDMVHCECGNIAIDGGFDYVKGTCKSGTDLEAIKVKIK